MYDLKCRYVDPMIEEKRAAGVRGAYSMTNDAIAVLFFDKSSYKPLIQVESNPFGIIQIF
jgi:hypothetical protein